MKVLFATTNPAKVKKYKDGLKEKGIELITLKDLELNLHVDETGKNALENAYIKARAYYDATGIVSIGMDNSLFFENVPEDKQPGTHVRRIYGKELTDNEMIEYYTNLVNEHGGRIDAKWVYGLVIYDGKCRKDFSWYKDGFYFTNTSSKLINPGYPLDSIAIVKKYNKYLVELDEEERKENNQNFAKDNEVIDFIVNNIK